MHTKLKIIIYVLMIIGMAFSMSFHLFGVGMHKLIGLLTFVLFIIHNMEGVEQLDLYYSSYIPQFFYAMMAPVLLFGITVWIDWRVVLVLLACVPLKPVSIVAVSRYAKRIFAKYWGKYTSMGDGFLDSVQGLRELKIFKTDAAQNRKMNESSEEFRKITMKVLVMQLASTTIMDLVAYGGAGFGIAVAVMGIVNRGLSPIAALFLILV